MSVTIKGCGGPYVVITGCTAQPREIRLGNVIDSQVSLLLYEVCAEKCVYAYTCMVCVCVCVCVCVHFYEWEGRHTN